MNTRNILPMSLALMAIAFFTLTSFTSPTWISGGRVWFAAGSQPADYDMGVTSPDSTGFKCAFIKSKVDQINGFGTYMQASGTDGYLGKSVQMTGWIMSKNVKNWAGMWFRVDGPDPMNSLSFDNMHDRPIAGNTAWKEYSIVLDVPENAKDLAFGVLLTGTGEVYFTNISFKVLGPATGKHTGIARESAPSDLNFQN